jgi:hypothetical protein
MKEDEMKYFTKAWARGGLTDEQWLANIEAHRARIEEITPQLPPHVRKLATHNINLHDGLIRRVALDRPARRLAISMRCGDLQVGYFDIDLAYSDVDLNLLNAKVLKAIARDPKNDADL